MNEQREDKPGNVSCFRTAFAQWAETFFIFMDPFWIMKGFSSTAERASRDKETFTEKLERAAGDDVFKYVLLINISALEGYVAQTRIQAQQSFRLCRVVSLIGFLLLIAGIGFGFYSSATNPDKAKLDSAYLASAAGIISQFIASIFFHLYNRTLQQMNRFHDRLITMQQTSMSFLASSSVQDSTKKDDAKIQLAQKLISLGDNTVPKAWTVTRGT